MNKQTTLAGYMLILAAITFWISWFLMPDPGTTDTNHILEIVRQSRMSVLFSVIIQIISSVLFVLALFLLAGGSLSQKRTLVGLILSGVGVLGLCSDAFFHLLAWFMTGDTVNIQEDVVKVMNFMQTQGLIFLVPLLLPFFTGSLLLAMGLKKQALISNRPAILFMTAFVTGLAGAIIANQVFGYSGQLISLSALGLFATGHVLIGVELIVAAKRESHVAAGSSTVSSLAVNSR